MAICDPQSPSVSNGLRDELLSERRQRVLLPSLALFCSVLLLVLAWYIATRSASPGSHVTPIDATQATLTNEQMQTFFTQQVRPQLDQYAQRNYEAIDRAEARIASQINTYRQDIPIFVEDISSWGTRFGVIGRSSQDLWERWWGESTHTTRVREYVSAKFATSLFSDEDLAALVEATLQQFRDDLQASQNRLYADIHAAWESQPYRQENLNLKQIVAQVDKHIQGVSHNMATDSVILGILAEIGGNAFANATTQLMKGILMRATTSLVTSTATASAASGGATGAGAAAGGAGGSVLGPGGTIIGITAGIVVGVATDWWLSHQFEQRLTVECEQLLSQIHDQIWIGNPGTPGLQQVLIDAIETLQETKELALRASLTEMVQ